LSSTIGVLDIGTGNLRSVSNAVYSLGYEPRLIEQAADIADCSHLLLPGVGAFDTAMQKFRTRGLAEPVRAFAASGRPVAGLCLGMQLLATKGEEGSPTAGLGVIPGFVRRLDPQKVPLVPHVGWNSVEVSATTHPVLNRIRSGVDFYFVHSFHFIPDSDTDVLATTDCGERFCSIVGHANVVGFQFHPEKSQANGLKLLEAFCEWDGVC
jgi:glutamine amidotransferase